MASTQLPAFDVALVTRNIGLIGLAQSSVTEIGCIIFGECMIKGAPTGGIWMIHKKKALFFTITGSHYCFTYVTV